MMLGDDVEQKSNPDRGHVYDAKRWIPWFLLLIGAAVIVPVSMWICPWRPSDLSFSGWFQRSGAIMTVFALAAEFPAINIFHALRPVGLAGDDFIDAQKRYGKYPKYMSWTVFAVAGTGTIIGSYGDLLI